MPWMIYYFILGLTNALCHVCSAYATWYKAMNEDQIVTIYNASRNFYNRQRPNHTSLHCITIFMTLDTPFQNLWHSILHVKIYDTRYSVSRFMTLDTPCQDLWHSILLVKIYDTRYSVSKFKYTFILQHSHAFDILLILRMLLGDVKTI